MNERERIEREAWLIADAEFLKAQTAHEIVQLVLRERAAAFESAAKAIKNASDAEDAKYQSERASVAKDQLWWWDDLNSSSGAGMLAAVDIISALAAQERAQAGEGGGRG